MEFPEVTVKEEKLYYEDDNDNFLDFNFDVKLKVELDSTCPDDWIIQNGENSQMFENIQVTVGYDELIESSKEMCFLCCNSYPNSFHLLQHNLSHLKVPLIKRKLFRCDHCPSYYTNIRDIEYHINAKHMPIIRKPRRKTHSKFCKCVICKKNKHILIKKNVSHMFKCSRCDMHFKHKKYLDKHIICIHEDYSKKIKCPMCPAILVNRYALTTHKRNCHEKKIQCELCDSVLKCQSYLYAHMRRVHYDDGAVHSCDVCGKIFKSPRYVKIHMKNSHKRRKKV